MSQWDVIALAFSGITALGIGILLWQVCILNKQNRRNAFNSLLQQWGDIERREYRRYVISEFKFGKGDNLEDLEDEPRKKVESVLAIYDRTSFLAEKHLISKKDVWEIIGRSMVQCWDKTENFIKARRRRRNEPEEGEPSSYVYYFQQFVTKNRKKLGM